MEQFTEETGGCHLQVRVLCVCVFLFVLHISSNTRLNVSTPPPPPPDFYISGGVLFSLQGLVLFLCSVSLDRQHKALMWASVRVIVLTATAEKIAWVRLLADQRLYLLRLDERRLKIFERCCESFCSIWS